MPDIATASDLPFVDIIWTITLICPWDCAICCQDAVHVIKRGDSIELRSGHLRELSVLPTSTDSSIFDQSLANRQAAGLELHLPQKIAVLDNLAGFNPKIDFSGGDPLVVRENLDVLQEAARRFGKESVTLTATGAGLARYDADDLIEYVGEMNFTYDSPMTTEPTVRPTTYVTSNLRRARALVRSGLRLRAECPLTKQNVSPATVQQIYLDLHEAGIQTLLVMRLFPVGRGATLSRQLPSRNEYLEAIERLTALEHRYATPRIKLQCALRNLVPTDPSLPNPCDLVRESYGLMPDGRLLASTWAISRANQPLDDYWVLGNLAEEPLAAIVARQKTRDIAARADDNFGQCKVFAYLNSTKPDPLDRMMDFADPLYDGLARTSG